MLNAAAMTAPVTIDRLVLLESRIYLRPTDGAQTSGLRLAMLGTEVPFSPCRKSDLPAALGQIAARFDLDAACRTSRADPPDAAPGTSHASSLNGLADWTLDGCDTLQVMIARRDEPVLVAFDAPVALPADAARLDFCAEIASHRARADLVVTLEDPGTGRVITRRARFDPACHGGHTRQGYQNLRLALPAAGPAMQVSFALDYLAYRDDGSDAEPFLFIADPRLERRGERPNIVRPRNLVPGPDRAASGWLVAPLPGLLGAGTDVTLLDGSNAMLLLSGARNRITLRENQGHTLIFQAETPLPAVLCIDGEPVLRMDLGAETAVRLPVTYLTGARRRITLTDESCSQTLFEAICPLPHVLTPVEVLQRETAGPLPAAVFAQSAHRYQSLRAQMAHASPETDLAQLARALAALETGHARVALEPLSFPRHDAPQVSIIIPAHGKVGVTYLALCSLLLAWNETSFEVIVVDDASTDDTARLEEIVTGITVIHNPVPQRFIRACNAGAAVARGDHIVLLNNDTEVTTGWLDALRDAFTRFDKVGLAGAKLLYPDGSLQDAGGLIWNSGNPWNYGNRQNPNDPRYSYARQADYLSGAALMVPRAVWDEVGGLSSYLEPMYFEDTDLAFKVRDAGYTTWFVPAAVVYHYEGMTSGTDTASGFKRFQEVNRPKFKRQWARAYAGHGTEGVKPDLEKDRGIVGRVLFADYTTPRPDQDAGSYAARQEMRLVQSLGYKVSFLPLNMAHFGPYTEDLQAMGVEVNVAPFFLSPGEYLERHAADFDAVYLTRYHVAQDILPLIRKHAPQARVLFNNADLHFLRELRRARSTGDPALMEQARHTRKHELEVISQVDVVLSYNASEHAVIEACTEGETPVLTCPWVVDIPPDVPPRAGRHGLSFLGSFRHHPNAEGITWFIREVLPAVTAALGDQSLAIYGADMTDAIRALASDHVRPMGYVPDLAQAFDPHRIFVAPLLSGAGIKGKVLAALSHGIPCVLSPIAAEGIGLRSGHDCFIAETPQDWLLALTRLSTEDDLWTQMSENARAYLRDSYSFAAGRARMRRAFEAADLYRSRA